MAQVKTRQTTSGLQGKVADIQVCGSSVLQCREPVGSWGPVHTNSFSNENRAVLLRILLSSTLQRRKRSPKTEPFENALQSGAIWKRCFLKTLFSSVDGENDAIWKLTGARPRDREYPKWRTDAIMRWNHLSMRTEGIRAFSKRIRRCSVDGWKRYENDKCGLKSFWKRSKTAPFSFENGLVWTGPKKTTVVSGTSLN